MQGKWQVCMKSQFIELGPSSLHWDLLCPLTGDELGHSHSLVVLLSSWPCAAGSHSAPVARPLRLWFEMYVFVERISAVNANTLQQPSPRLFCTLLSCLPLFTLLTYFSPFSSLLPFSLFFHIPQSISQLFSSFPPHLHMFPHSPSPLWFLLFSFPSSHFFLALGLKMSFDECGRT